MDNMYLTRHLTVLLLEVISQLFQPLILTSQEGVELGDCLPQAALCRFKEQKHSSCIFKHANKQIHLLKSLFTQYCPVLAHEIL